jgi:DNA (cytosine-5)-methyltransferase 1
MGGERPLLLDLFCGAGGAAMGYHRAGFEVVGVDTRPQPRYPFRFVQGDALRPPFDLGSFAAVHASPPCQHASDLRHMHGAKVYPEMIRATRVLLMGSGRPYVIENVEGAVLYNPLVLCGSMFGLGADCDDGRFHQLRRHRLFETSFLFLTPHCRHVGKPVGVYGNGGGNKARVEAGLVNGMTGSCSERKRAMGIEWMTRGELSQAIPPAYTEYIGRQLLRVVNERREAADGEG